MTFLNRENTEAVLREFIAEFPQEENTAAAMLDFVRHFDGAELTGRKNFTGHFTASCIITDRNMEKFLLLYHKGLRKWLQPGGHIEPEDASFLAAAVREAEEETGLSREDYDIMSTPEGLCVVDLDSHYIPANPLKGEPEHYHHDVRFLFRLKDGAPSIGTDPEESEGYRWFAPWEFPGYFRPERILEKLDRFCCVPDIRKTTVK